jgi:hypothetical protein
MNGVTLLSQSEIRLEWTDILGRTPKRKPKSADVRSSGVHLSGVIRYALQTIGQLQKDDESDEMPLRMAVGMAWEDWAVGLWPDMVWQPGEWEKDGVFGTPDGISTLFNDQLGLPPGIEGDGEQEYEVQYDVPVLEEFKATWKSRRTHEPVTNERIWMWQLAANCLAMNTTYARLHVLWVNGAYPKGAPSPVYMTYLISFQQKELERFWANVVLANKDKAPREEHT